MFDSEEWQPEQRDDRWPEPQEWVEHPDAWWSAEDEIDLDAGLTASERLTPVLESAQWALNSAEAHRLEAAVDALRTARAEGVPASAHRLDDGMLDRAFAIHLGHLLQLSPRAALALVHAADSAIRTLPQSWAVLHEGAASWRAVAKVVDFAEGLADADLPTYDTAAAELLHRYAAHELPRHLTRLRDRINADAANQRIEAATKRRHVAVHPEHDGQAALTFVGPATDIAATYDALHRIAREARGRDGETRATGQLMFDAGMDLLLLGAAHPPVSLADPGTPGERLGDARVPDRKAITATILVTVPAATATGAGDELGQLGGFGGLDAREAQRIIAHSRMWTRAEIDPIDGAILGFDSTERHIPAALRKLLAFRDDTCREPGCNRPAHRCDLDHSFAWALGGHTTASNLAALCRNANLIKETGTWHVETELDGTQTWTSVWGSRITTHPDRPTRPPTPPAPPPPPPRPSTPPSPAEANAESQGDAPF